MCVWGGGGVICGLKSHCRGSGDAFRYYLQVKTTGLLDIFEHPRRYCFTSPVRRNTNDKAGIFPLTTTYMLETPHRNYQGIFSHVTEILTTILLISSLQQNNWSASLPSPKSRPPTGAPGAAYRFMIVSKQGGLVFHEHLTSYFYIQVYVILHKVCDTIRVINLNLLG